VRALLAGFLSAARHARSETKSRHLFTARPVCLSAADGSEGRRGRGDDDHARSVNGYRVTPAAGSALLAAGKKCQTITPRAEQKRSLESPRARASGHSPSPLSRERHYREIIIDWGSRGRPVAGVSLPARRRGSTLLVSRELFATRVRGTVRLSMEKGKGQRRRGFDRASRRLAEFLGR